MLNRRKVYLSKVEGTKGVDSSPTSSANLILPNGDIKIAISTQQDSGEGDIKGTFGPGDSVTLKQSMALPVTTRVRGLGEGEDALLVPSIHSWLISSGHVVTSDGDGTADPRSAVYVPSSLEANLKSATEYCYEDGLLYKMLGAVGDLSFEASMNALVAKSNRQSKYTVPTVVVLPTWSRPPQDFFRMTSALMAITDEGSPISIGQFSFDTGTKVEENYETGAHFFEVGDRNPTITIDPKAVASAADWNALTNCTAAEIIATFTNGVGETLVFNFPRCVPMEITPADRAGRITRQKKFSLKETAGDDQYSITWTSVL